MSATAETQTLKVNEIFHSIQGESLLAGKPTTFVRTATCNLRCTYCLAPETPILCADFIYRPLGELREGDEIIGYSQTIGRKHKKLVRTRVIRIQQRESVDRIEVRTALGSIVCTPDHRVWHSELKGTARYGRWRRADKFVRGDGIKSVPVPKVAPADYEAYALGYLTGVADGDGCFWDFKPANRQRSYLRFRVSANDEEMLNRFREYGEFFGFSFSSLPHNAGSGFSSRTHFPSLFLLGGDGDVQRFRQILTPPTGNESWLRGYLGGIFDAEGSLSGGTLRISQCDVNEPIRLRIKDAADRLGFDSKYEERAVILRGGFETNLKFFALCNPAISRKRNDFFGESTRTSARVLDVVAAPAGPVITLTTECGSFVAGGLVVKNCDTPHAYWKGELLTVSEVVEKVKSFRPKYVCVTGGEPLGQRATVPLLEMLVNEGYTVSLETNGSFSVVNVPKAVIKVLDIKCPDSGEAEHMAWENLDILQPTDQVKFVVGSKADFDWSQRLCEERKLTEKCAVLFSPVFGKVSPKDLAGWILSSDVEVTMQVQMHKDLFGPETRGV